MRIMSWVAMLPILFLFAGCTKETVTEKMVVPERQASPRVKDSLSVEQSKQQITITKASLGKAFMLIPTVVSSGQNPDLIFIKPLIISFERSGDKIALFSLGEEQLYDTIPSDKLLQTFKIVSEDEKTIQINLSKGFTSLDNEDQLGVLIEDSFKEMINAIRSGAKSGLKIKDSFVRKTESANNSIYIEQLIRVSEQSIEQKLNDNDVKEPTLKTKETSSTLTIEIKPYQVQPTFKTMEYDKQQRIGYFINFAVKKQIDEPVPQIVRWDIDEQRGPIRVRIHEIAPVAVQKSMAEGILYWNRVFGREVLKIDPPFKSGERQPDRSIFVQWIPWDSAGFAKAGFQSDPLTGEIFRGQVFMTSSWYSSTKKGFSLELGTSNQAAESTVTSCVLDQSQMWLADIAELTNDQAAEKASTDSVRFVLAHEMGHALGLRHNFAGSSTLAMTDLDFLNYRKNYLKDVEAPTTAPATTVMDYQRGIETAMSGSFIRDHVLPYDQAAIGWAYLDQAITLEKYNYCSDEHIMFANKAKAKIYGCERFDKNKNAFTGIYEEILDTEKNRASKKFKEILTLIEYNHSPYKQTMTFDSASYIDFSTIDASSIEDFLYKNTESQYVTISNVMDGFLNSLSGLKLYINEYEMSNVIAKDSAALGGYSGLITHLLGLQNEAGGKLYESQTISFFENLNPDVYKDKITEEQVSNLKTKMLEKAKLADAEYFTNVLKSFPLTKKVTTYNEKTKLNEVSVKNRSQSFNMGDLALLSQNYLAVYETMYTKVITVQIGEVSKEYKFLNSSAENVDVLRQLFSPTADLGSEKYKYTTEMWKVLQSAKLRSYATTLSILTDLGVTKADQYLDPESLAKYIEGVELFKTNITLKTAVNNELAEYKKWIELK